jgi:hypothetical protein
MNNTKKAEMYSKIEQHGKNLNAIFNTQFDNIALCKKLLRLERKANKIALDWCNGENGIDSENIDTHTKPILKAVYKVLGTDKIKISFNGDARGYALKISDEIMRAQKLQLHQDWGGYGILAPDFN